MKRIVLISCVSKKLNRPAPAKELYVSTLFRSALRYAMQLRPDAIFVLSAKYGLVPIEQKIAPYNLTLNSMPAAQRRAWAERVAGDLRTRADLAKDQFIFLAGANYRRHLIPSMSHFHVPMSGLGIGKQLQFLKNQTGL